MTDRDLDLSMSFSIRLSHASFSSLVVFPTILPPPLFKEVFHFLYLHIRGLTSLFWLVVLVVIFAGMAVVFLVVAAASVVVAIVAFADAAIVSDYGGFVLVVAAVPADVAAHFVTFPRDDAVDAISLALAAAGTVVDDSSWEEGLTPAVLSSAPPFKHRDHKRLCYTLPLHLPSMAPFSYGVSFRYISRGTTRPAVRSTAFHHHRNPFPPGSLECWLFLLVIIEWRTKSSITCLLYL